MTASVTVVDHLGPPENAEVPGRKAAWLPWALFLAEMVITALVIGILSATLVAQLTLSPGAIFGEFDNTLNWAAGLGMDAAFEVIAAVFVFGSTGLVVGLLGLPIRLIGPLRRAWLGNGEATIAGTLVGVLLMIAAYVFGTWGSVDQGQHVYAVYAPSAGPLLVGWFVLAFSLSLLVWPVRWLPHGARRWWTETQLTK